MIVKKGTVQQRTFKIAFSRKFRETLMSDFYL